jgi:hemoglobin-like flavoprotein
MTLNASFLEQSFAPVAPTEATKQAFGREFYTTLLRLHPEVEPLYAHTIMEEQARKLMAMLSLVLHLLKKPEVLATRVRRLGRRHQELGVRAEHYPIVAKALLATFASRLGEQWTAQMQAAWTEAYEAIVSLMSQGYTSS